MGSERALQPVNTFPPGGGFKYPLVKDHIAMAGMNIPIFFNRKYIHRLNPGPPFSIIAMLDY